MAFAFCQPADCWGSSALGRRLRCLLVCSLDREHIQGSHNSDLVVSCCFNATGRMLLCVLLCGCCVLAMLSCQLLRATGPHAACGTTLCSSCSS